MEFDRTLSVGARGGHGPVRYFVEEYVPGESIKFRFTAPNGFNGFHAYERIKTITPNTDVLRHTLEIGQSPRVLAWSPWVRFLRWVVSGGKGRAQVTPNQRLQGTPASGRPRSATLDDC